MKFGKNLSRNQVPEWSHSYIQYRSLKKLLGKATETQKQGYVPDTTEFFYNLDRNLEEVDHFYNKKYADATRRLKLLNDQYGKTLENPNELDGNEVEDLIEGLLELRDSLRKLQWYGEVNRRGFVKITKKLDKKIPEHKTRKYVESKVDTKAFSSSLESSGLINQINDWLSKAGDAKQLDEKNPDKSALALPRVSAKAVLDISRTLLDDIDGHIRNDDVDRLVVLLRQAITESSDADKEVLYQRLLSNLLQRAITCHSKRCIVHLLNNIVNLDEGNDFNQRNCLHRYVLSMNRTRDGDSPSLHPVTELNEDNYVTPATAPFLNIPSRGTKEVSEHEDGIGEDKATVLLDFILENLSGSQRSALIAPDNSGRIPLHYAAMYGFVAFVKNIIARMQEWGQFEFSNGIDAPFYQDSDGLSPLHLSIMGKHYYTTKTLLKSEEWRRPVESIDMMRKHMGTSSQVLALATESDSVEIVRLLVVAGVGLNYQDDQGETALHVAARHGRDECAKVLLAVNASEEKINLEIRENTFGWTPLFIACVDGHLNMVKLLLEAGADSLAVDMSGWTPGEHASLRGHIKVSRELAMHSAPRLEDLSSTTEPSAPSSESLGERRSASINNGNTKTTTPVKSFGHRCLTNETMILISLGSMDMRKSVDIVKLDRIPLAAAHRTQLDTALSVVVSAHGASGDGSIVDLPVQESTEPIEFMTKDVASVKILFDIVPTYAGSEDKIVGRGVAMPGSLKPNLGSNRMALQGDLSVPIVASHNLEVIGCVNFNFIVVTPFHHPNISITEGHTYWKSLVEPLVIGHRGLGKNQASRTSLQLGENTIQSFIAAANLGAQYVEFDVQLTKDHVPVIYHDFLVSETGIDAPVHLLTLEQFMHVSDGRTPRQSRQTSPKMGVADSARPLDQRRPRSLSVGTQSETNDEMNERMKHTRDFKQKGFKANSRNFIQAPFTTLEEMFQKLPEHIGFNIEVKYPMLFESEEHEMDTYAVELNHFVDSVLKKVFDLNRGRNIIMSSFNPDICLLLAMKQPSIPILFLSDGGLEPVSDVRASSLQEAVRFASRWNLLGVVTAAEPLCLSPRLVQVVKESGLMCVSYGTLNNDPKMVKLQIDNGIDAVIVDSVLAIRKGLTSSEAAAAIKEPEGGPNLISPGSTNGVEASSIKPMTVPPEANGSARIRVS